eukprot:gene5968-7434_t
MANIFESYEDEINTSFTQFEQIVSGFNQLTPDQKKSKLDEMDQLINGIDCNMQTLNIESNRTGKSTSQYAAKLSQAKRTYQKYKDTYYHEKNLSDLMSSSTYRSEFSSTQAQTQRERAIKSNKNLEEGINMIKLANREVRENQDTAIASVNELHKQRETLISFEKKNRDESKFKKQLELLDFSLRSLKFETVVLSTEFEFQSDDIAQIISKHLYDNSNNNISNNSNSFLPIKVFHVELSTLVTLEPTPHNLINDLIINVIDIKSPDSIINDQLQYSIESIEIIKILGKSTEIVKPGSLMICYFIQKFNNNNTTTDEDDIDERNDSNHKEVSDY